jgi:hypothetical protein
MRLVAATADGIVVDGESAAMPDARLTWLQPRPGGWVGVIAGRVVHLLDSAFGIEESAVLGDLRAQCAAWTPTGVLVGTSEAHLLDFPRLRRVKGFDRVDGRDDWFTPWGAPADVRSISAGPDGTTYVNVHVGGVVVSTDGERWSDTMDISNDVHHVLAHPERDGVALAAAAVGLGVTTDGGATWEWHDDGLDGRYMRAVAVDGSRVLVSASRGSGGSRAAVYRWDLDRRGPFERCEEGLPEWFDDNVDTMCLAVQRRHAAIGAPDGTVWRSGDGGESWEAAFEVDGVRAVHLATAPGP